MPLWSTQAIRQILGLDRDLDTEETIIFAAAKMPRSADFCELTVEEKINTLFFDMTLEFDP